MNRLCRTFGGYKLLSLRDHSASYMNSVYAGNASLTAFINGKCQQFVTAWHVYRAALEEVFVKLFLLFVLKKPTLWQQFDLYVIARYVVPKWIVQIRKRTI